MTMWSIGGIFGYAAFGFIADAIGRRPTIFLYNLGTLLVGLYLYLMVDNFGPYPPLLFAFGFFVFGFFPATRCICRNCSRHMCGRQRYRSATAPAGSSPASDRWSPGCLSVS